MADKLPRGLYALVDDGLATHVDMPTKAAAVLEAGGRIVQLRFKRTPQGQAVCEAKAVVAVARQFPGAVVIVNDRPDWALLAGAHGVHLGQDDVPIAWARRVLGPAALIGATVRSLADIVAAAAQGADHVGLGPVFPTTTKQVDAPPLGLAGFEAIAARSPLPVVAIAGIQRQHLPALRAAGAHAAAIASELWKAPNFAATAQALHQAFLAPS